MSEKRQKRKITYEHESFLTRAIVLPVLALILTLIIEAFNHGLSPVRLVKFITGQPGFFLYNWLILLTSLAFSELFKKRRAVLITMFVVWAALGFTNLIVIKDRTRPFCFGDILMMKDAFSLITIYFTWPQIILMFGGGFALIFVIIMMFGWLPRREYVNLTLSLGLFIGLVLSCFCVCALSVHAEAFPAHIDNPVDAYDRYGFAACFTYTFGQQGISKPEDYSSETVAEILEDIDGDKQPAHPTFDADDNLEHPNIIFLQLESFFDVNTIVGSSYSADPTPNFNFLTRNFPHGELYVPTVGGGTANVEFEMISGLNLDYFGTGELPYNTILQQRPCETIAFDLKEYGYKSTAMHSNTATFFSRNEVFPRLGFDRFVPLEYMLDPAYNETGWCSDRILISEIQRALRTTEERDMVFTITVESHGKYADTYEPAEGDIEVLSLPEQIPLAPFQNYCRLIHVTDDFLGEFIRQMEWFDEPTICVIYGDHLPALELSNDVLSTGDIYASRYILWNNYGADLTAPDIQCYRLGAELLKQLGFSGGVITKYHQSYDPSETGADYLADLEMLEYDQLYGEMDAYGGTFPYTETDMQMGSEPLLVTNADTQYGRLLVTGKNFTEFSHICVEDELLDTVYIDRTHIAARIDKDSPPESFSVVQLSRDGSCELGRTEEYRME